MIILSDLVCLPKSEMWSAPVIFQRVSEKPIREGDRHLATLVPRLDSLDQSTPYRDCVDESYTRK